MNKLKSKLQGGKKERSKSNAGNPSDESMLDAFRKFYSTFEKHLVSMLNSGSRFRAMGKSKKESAPKYAENTFVEFMNKHGTNLTRTHRDALEYMSTCYTDIASFKHRRDCALKSDVYDPIHNTTLEQLEHIAKLRKELASAESSYASAQKAVEKNGEQTAMLKRDQAAAQRERAQTNLDQATKDFKNAESSRLAVLCSAAQAQSDFYKSAADSFAKLCEDLNNLRNSASDTYSTTPSYNPGPSFTGGGGVSDTYALPDLDAGPSMPQAPTNGNLNQSGSKCRALYDFTAEQDDDLSLKKDEIATVIEKVDDDWYFGEKNGKRGHFPIKFVELIN